MNILGISAFFHDASAALIQNGKIIASAAEERYTFQKHDLNFPRFSIEFCLKSAQLNAQDLDAIVFYEEPHTKFTRVLCSAFANYPFSTSAFVRSMRSWMTTKLWVRNSISKRLNVHPRIIEYAPHHMSHAAQAFLSSPFTETAILVIDSVGEWGSTTLCKGTRKEGKFEIQKLDELPYPHSLGLVYSAFTAYLGFRVNDGECSTMALAAFGKPRYTKEIRQVIQIQTDGTYRVDQSYFNFDEFRSLPLSRKFYDTFGEPRKPNETLPFDSLGQVPVAAEQQRYADIAASVQLVFEQSVLALCQRLYRLAGEPNLCFAGGAALNCVLNSKILKDTPFTDLYIPPDPGDGGAAAGAALYHYYHRNRLTVPSFVHSPYLGQSYDEEEVLSMLQYVEPDYWINHRFPGGFQKKGMKLKVDRFNDFERLLPSVAQDLHYGKIVGWFQGRFENGPRALGNRSLLSNPKNIQTAKRLSSQVKQRASFRPYAFSVTADKASNYLEESTTRLSKWMQSSTNILEGARDSVAAAQHIDGSTRPQVCTREDNPKYYSLLKAYEAESGHPTLLNTSMNDSGFPMVSSPTEALLMFARTDMDTLVINNSVIRKE